MTLINPWADFMIAFVGVFLIARAVDMIRKHRPSIKIRIKRNKIDTSDK